MSINIKYQDEYPDSLFCDLCRCEDASYRLLAFKQYNGMYCRHCYELVDEDADEEDDNNYIITIRMLRVTVQTTNSLCLEKTYYYMKQVCNQIRSMNLVI